MSGFNQVDTGFPTLEHTFPVWVLSCYLMLSWFFDCRIRVLAQFPSKGVDEMSALWRVFPKGLRYTVFGIYETMEGVKTYTQKSRDKYIFFK